MTLLSIDDILLQEVRRLTKIEHYDKLALLMFQIECGVGLLDVICECMRCSPYETESFFPAVYAAYAYFSDIAQTVKQLKGDVLDMQCQ